MKSGQEKPEETEDLAWTCHAVFDDPSVPYSFNFHTHGLQELFDHPDLQIVLPVAPELALEIFRSAVQLIAGGIVLCPESRAPGIIRNFRVGILPVTDNGARVYRLIIPDVAGNLDPRVMDPVYARQYGLGLRA